MTTHHLRARVAGDRGIALLLSLFLVLAVSIVTSSIMFLGQSETYSGNNYRLMSQARYGAESGIQVAANYLLYTYAAPTTGGTDDIAVYNYVGTSPVTWNGQPVVLSANASVASNYPVPAVQAAFAAAATGTLAAGNTNVSYGPYATLMSMQQVNAYGGATTTIQTWKIVSDGTVNTGGKAAQVEVSSVLETQAVPATMYAAFATNAGCGAIDLQGNKTTTGSYNSTAAVGGSGTPVTSSSGGNMGTNGNLTEGGNATVNGTLSTPRVGVGACSSGNVDALTSCNNCQVTGGLVQLPQEMTLPTPTAPNPAPPTTSFSGNGQTLLNGASVGNVSVTSHATLTLGAPGVTSVITMNSLSLAGNATLQILGTVILQIAGSGSTTPLDLTGGSVTNGGLTTTDFDPAHFQITYAGTGTIKSAGGSSFVGVVYAPNADIQLTGGTSIYGSVIGNTIQDEGGATIYYDQNLNNEFYTVGNAMLSAFSWKKY